MSGTNYIASNWRVPENSNSSKNDNYSLSFDPADTEYINLGSSSDLAPGTGEFTFSAWINPASWGAGYHFIWGTPVLGGMLIGKLSSGDFGVRASSVGNFVETATLPTLSTWTHICITRDSLNTLTLYYDGQFQTADLSVTQDFATGSTYVGSESVSHFDGKMSDVCFFDYALSISQIESLVGKTETGAGNPMALKPTPVAYYPLGDNSSGDPVTQPNVSVDDASVFYMNPLGIEVSSKLGFQDGTNAFSGGAWVNIGAGVNATTMSRQRGRLSNGAYPGWHFGTTGSGPAQGDPEFEIRGNDPSQGWLRVKCLSYTLQDGLWHFIAFTYDGSLDASGVKLYVDGYEDTYRQVLVNNFTGTTTDYNTPFVIGGGQFNSGNTRFGSDQYMSNPMYFESELSASDILTLYNDGIPLNDLTSFTSLKARWKLDQSANWEADTVGNWQIPDTVSAYPKSFSFNSNIIEAPKLNLTSAICVSFWMKTTDTGVQFIVNEDRTSNPDRNWAILLASNKLNFLVYHTDGTYTQFIRSTALEVQDGNWHNVVFTWDGTTTANAYKTFIDGGNEESTTATSTGIRNLSPYGLAIGQVQQAAGYPYNGELSNVCVWDTVLENGGEETLYNNGTPLTTAIASDNLKAWYKLNNNEKFDGSNWSVENQKYPSNYDSALNFGGSDYVDVSTISLGTTQTLSWWINRDSSSTQECPFGDTTSGLSDMLVYMNGLTLYYRVGSTSLTWTNALSAALTNQKWCNIILTRNGASAKLYLNGDFVSEQTLTGGDITAAVQIDRIGASSAGTPAFYINGKLSNVAIWTSDQTTEVSNIYNNGTPANSYTNTPVSWWKLNNLTTGIQDSTGSNNGTNNGATKVNTFVSTEAGISSGMTEQNLVNNNVSTLNGESSGMTSGNLVLSDLTRNLPYENYSLDFDGTEYIDCGDSDDFSFGNGTTDSPFSVSFWVNLDAIPPAAGFFAKDYDASNREWTVGTFSGPGKIRFLIKSLGGGSQQSIDSTTILSTGQWYHITCTYDGSGGNNAADGLTIYINGIAETPTNITKNTYVAMANTTAPLTTGMYQLGGTPLGINGKFSNTSIFNVELTPTEVLKLYANGMPQDLTNFAPQPVGWWTLGKESFWNGSDWIARDMIGSNDGTSSNMAVSDLAGDAPRSEANGTGTNMDIPTNLVGNAGFSDKNAYSINMGPSARVTDTP
jgi:hypothetical protein